MKIEMRRVTWYSKALAMAIFIIVPFIAFYLGVKFQELRETAALRVVQGNAVLCSLTADACTAQGGTVLNTLGSGTTCPAGQENLGEVAGLRCPCICCK